MTQRYDVHLAFVAFVAGVMCMASAYFITLIVMLTAPIDPCNDWEVNYGTTYDC